jgi:hypothetical protein
MTNLIGLLLLFFSSYLTAMDLGKASAKFQIKHFLFDLVINPELTKKLYGPNIPLDIKIFESLLRETRWRQGKDHKIIGENQEEVKIDIKNRLPGKLIDLLHLKNLFLEKLIDRFKKTQQSQENMTVIPIADRAYDDLKNRFKYFKQTWSEQLTAFPADLDQAYPAC